jgi:hypothetical protein
VADSSFTQPLKGFGTRKQMGWVQFTTAAGAGAATAVTSEGVDTVSRGATGIYILNLPFACKGLHVAVTAGGAAAAQTVDAVVRSVSPSGKTVTLALVTKAAPADTDVAAVTLYVTVWMSF